MPREAASSLGQGISVSCQRLAHGACSGARTRCRHQTVRAPNGSGMHYGHGRVCGAATDLNRRAICHFAYECIPRASLCKGSPQMFKFQRLLCDTRSPNRDGKVVGRWWDGKREPRGWAWSSKAFEGYPPLGAKGSQRTRLSARPPGSLGFLGSPFAKAWNIHRGPTAARTRNHRDPARAVTRPTRNAAQRHLPAALRHVRGRETLHGACLGHVRTFSGSPGRSRPVRDSHSVRMLVHRTG